MPPRRSKRRRDNDAADDAASAVVAAAAGPAAAHDVADDAADDVAEANAASSRDDDGGDGNDDDGAPRCVVFSFLPFPRPPARPPARAAIFVVRRQFPWRVGIGINQTGLASYREGISRTTCGLSPFKYIYQSQTRPLD